MPGQRVVPFIAYEDAAAAILWLGEAFGFVEDESARHTDEEGTITHAELSLEGGLIYLASPTPEYQGPKRHRESCEAARRWQDNEWVIDGHFVAVGDVDAHHARAKAAGATILREPVEPGIGERIYTAEDLEGHRWMFGSPR
jgi:PhnB protein